MLFSLDDREYDKEDFKPLRLVRWIVRCPLLVAIASLSIAILLTVIALTQPIEIDKRIQSMRVLTDPAVTEWDAYKKATSDTFSIKADPKNSTTINKRTVADQILPYSFAEDTAWPGLASLLPESRHFLFPAMKPTTKQRRDELAGNKEPPKERNQRLGNMVICYQSKSKDENLLVDTPLEFIRSFEAKLLAVPGYEDWCRLHLKKTRLARKGEIQLPEVLWKTECQPRVSIVNFFFPTLNLTEPRQWRLYNVYDFDGQGGLYAVSDVKMVFGLNADLGSLLDRNFTLWYQRSRVARTVLNWGGPLPGFSLMSGEEWEQQRAKLLPYLLQLQPVLQSASTEEVKVVYAGSEITSYEVDKVIFADIGFALGSFLFVFVWMWFHTRSLFLTVCGMIHILVSIPSGYFVIRVVLQNQYVGILMCMVLFIILGIGCDDVFILFDAFKQSTVQKRSIVTSLERRMDWVFRRAAGTMFVTSFTTAAAFLSNVFSSLIPIRMFGIFMATIVIMNFLLVITWYPAIIVLWYRYLAHRGCGKTVPFVKHVFGPRTDVFPEGVDRHYDDGSGSMKLRVPRPVDIFGQAEASTVELADLKPSEDPDAAHSEGEDDYRRKEREKLTKDQGEDEEGLQSPDRPSDSFDPSNFGLEKKFMIDPMKLGVLDRFFYYKYVPFVHKIRWVIVVFFTIFAITSASLSVRLRPQTGEPQFFPPGHNLWAVDNLERHYFPVEDNSFQEVSIVWGILGIDRAKADTYNPEDLGEVLWDGEFDLAVPASQQFIIDAFQTLVNASDSRGKPLALSTDLHRCFMCAFSEWCGTQSIAFPIADRTVFWTSMKKWLRDGGEKFLSDLGWTESEVPQNQTLKYAALRIRANINQDDASTDEKLQAKQDWRDAIEGLNTRAPRTLNRSIVTTEMFMWSVTEQTLTSTAIFGTIVSLVAAFIVLVIFTMNVIVALYAIISITVVLLGLLGFLVIAGWEVGIIESIALTIIVGLSVDYTVHIALSYISHAQHHFLASQPRLMIVQYAMAEIGASVLGGALTTSSSVLMLFFCTITFFSKFGQFVFVNITFSLVTSFTLLLALLLLIGPRASTGNLLALFQRCKPRT